jgi:hypothetical protein
LKSLESLKKKWKLIFGKKRQPLKKQSKKELKLKLLPNNTDKNSRIERLKKLD